MKEDVIIEHKKGQKMKTRIFKILGPSSSLKNYIYNDKFHLSEVQRHALSSRPFWTVITRYSTGSE
jgi:hypothetical protein